MKRTEFSSISKSKMIRSLTSLFEIGNRLGPKCSPSARLNLFLLLALWPKLVVDRRLGEFVHCFWPQIHCLKSPIWPGDGSHYFLPKMTASNSALCRSTRCIFNPPSCLENFDHLHNLGRHLGNVGAQRRRGVRMRFIW